MSDNTPTPVEIPMGNNTGMHRAPSGESPIPISRIHIPVVMWVVTLLAVIGGTLGFAATWNKTADHVEQASPAGPHVPSEAAFAGGGIAYKADVAEVRVEAERRSQEEQKRTRRLLRQMTMDCRGSAGRLNCRVNLPEEEP